MRKLFLLLFLFLGNYLFSQTIPTYRTENWSLAGYQGMIPDFSTVKNILNFGGIADGQTPNDSAFMLAIADLGEKSGVIFFPAGTYFFTMPLVLRDSLIIRGEGSATSKLLFNCNGYNDLISTQGSQDSLSQIAPTFASLSLQRGDNLFPRNDTALWQVGDWAYITEIDTDLMFSPWAHGDLGQVVQVQTVSSNSLTFTHPLRLNYDINRQPRLIKIHLKHDIGIECLSIERQDVSITELQTNNILFKSAYNCWVTGVESNKTNFCHISVFRSSNLTFSGNYFHHAFDYGGGGRAYGVGFHQTSGECLVENNIFEHLRHAMLLQAAANANVLAYNYAFDSYWTEGIYPTDACGDIVCHGNLAYANLIEGNICQNIAVDNSHGLNGNFNTFFRNRAEKYGLVMNSSPASDSQNFVCNELVGTGFLQGMYTLAGGGHFEYGNNVQGNITPAGTNAPIEQTIFYANIANFQAPIGNSAAYNIYTNPAKDRNAQGIKTDCSKTHVPLAIHEAIISEKKYAVFPNPTKDILYIKGENNKSYLCQIIDMQGKLLATQTGNTISLAYFPQGIYTIVIQDAQNKSVLYSEKVEKKGDH